MQGTEVMTSEPPRTPLKAQVFRDTIARNVEKLSLEFDLELRQSLDQSSHKNLTELDRECISTVKFLIVKNAFDDVYKEFEPRGKAVYYGWVAKPMGDRSLLPMPTKDRPRPVTARERHELKIIFLEVARPKFAELKKVEMSRGTRSGTGARRKMEEGIDDSSIPFALATTVSTKQQPKAVENRTSRAESKRSRENADTSISGRQIKRPKSNSPPIDMHEHTISAERGRQVAVNFDASRKSVNTSFASTSLASTSFTSTHPSTIFDRSVNDIAVQSTQDTEPTPSFNFDVQAYRGEQDSSNYGSSFSNPTEVIDLMTSFDRPTSPRPSEYHQAVQAAECLSQDLVGFDLSREVEPSVPESLNPAGVSYSNDAAEKALRNTLEDVFPRDSPSSLLAIPFYCQYEITRVFLYAGVRLSLLKGRPAFDFRDYDKLWEFLRAQPALKSFHFPQKTENAVWDAAIQQNVSGFRGVTIGASLQYTAKTCSEQQSVSEPLFSLKLKPLKLDYSHRLERRFGSDRFIEVDIPVISGSKIPKRVRDLGERAKSILIDWLRCSQPLAGRTWESFCTKPIKAPRNKKKKGSVTSKNTIDNSPAFKIYFFATSGFGFGKYLGTPSLLETHMSRTELSIAGLLNWLRPASLNKEQPYLKLYARTPLGLSRNRAAVTLEPNQIVYKSDVKFNGEVMTDGAGRISHSLAQKVATKLGLDYLPSAFQGRLGDAKGVWSINPMALNDNEEWMEVYDSQRKWKRWTDGDPDFEDPGHRTFEVNFQSGELKSAELNTQLLPILLNSATDKYAMRLVLETLLEKDLIDDILSQRLSMKNPQSCRVWLQETNASSTDKIKLGVIPYAGGMPLKLIDRIAMLLDAGFDPETMSVLVDMMRKLYAQRCDELKGDLKINISRSTYALMVPDFAGILEPDEVFLHLSKNIGPPDSVLPRSGFPLRGIEMLVARSPAHFASDIQKVKAVVRTELLGLQDVIVFSTKGNPSLAAKLSGGDYDGDMAWICWEPSIVENFENSEVPECPDLVAEGYIDKISTTYEELIVDPAAIEDPTAFFLKRSFEFNLEQGLLGICTGFKEDWAYFNKDKDPSLLTSDIAIYQGKLLSDLVDAPKQGFIFTEKHWSNFKRKALKSAKTTRPAYKNNEIDPRSSHIIDRLRYVADRTIDRVLTEFSADLPPARHYDPQLQAMFQWAMRKAERNSKLCSILSKLKTDIQSVKESWNEYWNKKQSKDEKSEESDTFAAMRDECFERFQNIKPDPSKVTTSISFLLGGWHNAEHLTEWSLLRASACIAENQSGSFSYWMAGRELCYLKALQHGGVVPIKPEMYAMLKPDARFVKRRIAEIDGKVKELLSEDELDDSEEESF